MDQPTIWDHLLALVVGVLLPLQAWLAPRASAAEGDARRPEPMLPREKIATYWANSALLWLLALLVAWAWIGAGRGLGALGLRGGTSDTGAGWLLALLALLYLADIAWKVLPEQRRRLTRERWRRETPFMPSTPREVAHALVLVGSAGVCEEIAFRGHLVSYLRAVLGADATLPAVLLPALVFGLSHRYQGAASMLKIALMAAAFGAYFVLSGTLWPLIAMHLAVDLVGMLVSPWLMREEGGAEPEAG